MKTITFVQRDLKKEIRNLPEKWRAGHYLPSIIGNNVTAWGGQKQWISENVGENGWTNRLINGRSAEEVYNMLLNISEDATIEEVNSIVDYTCELYHLPCSICGAVIREWVILEEDNDECDNTFICRNCASEIAAAFEENK